MMSNIPQLQSLMQMLPHIKANPMQFLLQRKLNIPQAMTSDPNAIINHLLQTGQVSQAQMNNAYQMAQQMGYGK